MPLSDHLEQEGVVIPPTRLTRRGRINERWLKGFLQQVRTPTERRADLLAQQAANRMGVQRLKELSQSHGIKKTLQAMHDYQDYERRITLNALKKIPKGTYRFTDTLDDDGLGARYIPITVHLKVMSHKMVVDLRESAKQVSGPVNATYAITLSAVAYVLRCLVFSLSGEDCAAMKVIDLKTRPGTVVDAQYPAPVAGGNVETSQRIVDVLLGALSQALPNLIPAASQGTMNNLAVGSKRFTYYETMAGGMGAGPHGPGENAMHSHMTNTLNTPIEALETELPLRITRYQLRPASGGKGRYRGGKGLIREYEFLEKAQASLLTERRRGAPYGLQGGGAGQRGQNYFIDRKGKTHKLPAKTELNLKAGEGLGMKTPGGGGWGRKP
jgi:N-methylhydantoinase B